MGVRNVPNMPVWECDARSCSASTFGDPEHEDAVPPGWWRGDAENGNGLGGPWVACKLNHVQQAVQKAVTPEGREYV